MLEIVVNTIIAHFNTFTIVVHNQSIDLWAQRPKFEHSSEEFLDESLQEFVLAYMKIFLENILCDLMKGSPEQSFWESC